MLSKINSNELKSISAGWQWDKNGDLWLNDSDIVRLRPNKIKLSAYCLSIELKGYYCNDATLVSLFLLKQLKISPSKNLRLNCHKFTTIARI